MPHVRTRSILISVAAAAALIAGGTAAGAAIAGPIDGSGVIHGCWTNASIRGSHVFVLQDAGTTCPNGATAISWNQQGPAGPAGPTGPTGPAGPAGVTHAWTAASASVGSASFILGAPIVEVDNLPPGNYVATVTGETDATAAGENFAQCFLESDSGLIQQQDAQISPPGQGTYALTGATSLPNGGTIILRCGTQVNTGVNPINFVDNSLTVIQVDAIN